MVKDVVRHISLPGIIPEDETIDLSQITFLVDSRVLQVQLLLPIPGPSPDRLNSIHRVRVSGKPARKATPVRARVHPLQRFEEIGHLRGIITPSARILDTQIIRLSFIIPAETEK